ncbi:uncharacterized protein METZ01_LOCUS107216 [marine metagenome]|uniref:Uncharacterized protein n=1 Tax=marine metagenome TaxID=408172 RepID=A0A381WPP0_9ZZZZ
MPVYSPTLLKSKPTKFTDLHPNDKDIINARSPSVKPPQQLVIEEGYVVVKHIG